VTFCVGTPELTATVALVFPAALALLVAIFVDVDGATLVETGDGARPADDAGFGFADLLVIGFDPEQNSQAQSPLSCESPINQRR
jgi:hypothetical protein